ncbi:MAG: hypothetical protein IPI67_30555 [Myxococcales bacterium]|nr:hypothetical protein [Myxococcales bacterium]
MSKLDYRKFLSKGERTRCVLPYFGGRYVHDATRRYSINVEQPPGWYEFELDQRVATPVDRAEPPDLSALPAVRGHFARGWLFGGGRDLTRVELLPAEEPPVLSPVIARRSAGGELVFDSLEFETEAEEACRVALEEERGINDVKGVSAALRAAFGYALAARIGARMEIAISPREAMRAVSTLSSDGRERAERLLRELEEERRLERVRIDAWLRSEGRQALPHGSSGPDGWRRPETGRAGRTPAERAHRALDEAGAELSGYRVLGDGMLEVTYRFLGERFISVVDEQTLQVIDAGICLSGSDRMVTLESLPSVIREGYENDELNITRR